MASIVFNLSCSRNSEKTSELNLNHSVNSWLQEPVEGRTYPVFMFLYNSVKSFSPAKALSVYLRSVLAEPVETKKETLDHDTGETRTETILNEAPLTPTNLLDWIVAAGLKIRNDNDSYSISSSGNKTETEEYSDFIAFPVRSVSTVDGVRSDAWVDSGHTANVSQYVEQFAKNPKDVNKKAKCKDAVLSRVFLTFVRQGRSCLQNGERVSENGQVSFDHFMEESEIRRLICDAGWNIGKSASSI